MSEKEKMLDGHLYIAMDPSLVAERTQARALLDKFNSAHPGDFTGKTTILKELLGHIGSDVIIEPPLRVDYGINISIGDRSYMNFGCVILDCAKVDIGENVLFGPNVQLYSATHPTDPQLRLEGKEYALPIRIGNNVWIGGGAIILPGVTIGDHTTIGAGSVVTKSIPPCVVAVGNPCRVIKHVAPPGFSPIIGKE